MKLALREIKKASMKVGAFFVLIEYRQSPVMDIP
jgi:hypothetical protein